MCKYINFNNLRKKKGFVGGDGGVVVGWNSPLWKHKKQLGKYKKKKEKTQKTIYSMNSEKTMKTSFYCSQKSGFWEHKKHKKQKHTPFPKQVFCVFCFQEQKTVLENKNQTSPTTSFWTSNSTHSERQDSWTYTQQNQLSTYLDNANLHHRNKRDYNLKL